MLSVGFIRLYQVIVEISKRYEYSRGFPLRVRFSEESCCAHHAEERAYDEEIDLKLTTDT